MTGAKIQWQYFSYTMAARIRTVEPRFAPLLEAVEPADRLVGQLVNRQTSPVSDAPQDYVACVLVARAFRLTIACIQLALSGYPDACPNLTRTVWEIGMRLLDMSGQPLDAAFGYLIEGATEELSAVQADLARQDADASGEGFLRENAERIQAHLDVLRDAASSRGVDPDVARRKHGKLNYREVCRRFGIEIAYLVDYAFASGYVHEKNWATREFVSETEGERQFELGPIPDGCAECVGDALTQLFQVINFAASVLHDEAVVAEGEAVLRGLERRYRRVAQRRPANEPV